MKHRSLLTLSTTLSLVACQPVEDVSPLGANEESIAYGDDERVENAVVRVTSPGGTCSGVLINPDQVLTASHCLLPRPAPRPGMPAAWGLWETPGVSYGWYPSRTANAALTSGVKERGAMVHDVGFDRPGTDYLTLQGGALTGCSTTCFNDPRCVAFTYRPATISAPSRCWLKQGHQPVVSFGPEVSAPIHQVSALRYNAAGAADIVILTLASPVPSGVARPMRVATSLPAGMTGAGADRRFDLRAFGFGLNELGALSTVRQTATFQFGQMPIAGDSPVNPNAFSVTAPTVGGRCAAIRPGDSGGPIVDRAYGVLGVVKSTRACGGVYTATFGRGGRASDGQMTPDIGRWLDAETNIRRASWTSVGRLANARRLAVSTHGVLYAQRNDGRLFKSVSGGRDGSWVDIGSLPADLLSLVPHARGLDYLTADRTYMTYDEVTRRSTIGGRMPEVKELAATEDSTLDFSVLLALHNDGSVWIGELGGGPRWTRLVGPSDAQQIATDRGHLYLSGADGRLRVMRMSGDGALTDMGSTPGVADLAAAARGQDDQQRYLYRLAPDGTILQGIVGFGDEVR